MKTRLSSNNYIWAVEVRGVKEIAGTKYLAWWRSSVHSTRRRARERVAWLKWDAQEEREIRIVRFRISRSD
jgi:hypothetical protein